MIKYMFETILTWNLKIQTTNKKKIPLTKFYKSLVVGKTSLRGAPYPPPRLFSSRQIKFLSFT